MIFELQQGVQFHDGTPFDAHAVKWNFDRWVGKEDYGFFRTSTVVQKVEATDPDTVTLTLSEPYEPLIQELSIVRPVRFLSPASVAADSAFARPVGTGPWRFESSSATEAVLVRHDGYWGDAPSLGRVSFRVIPDSQTRVSALRSGEVDLIGGSYLAPITPLEATGLQQTDGVRLLTGDPDTTFLLSFSTRGPAADRAVREAVGLAIDREASRRCSTRVSVRRPRHCSRRVCPMRARRWTCASTRRGRGRYWTPPAGWRPTAGGLATARRWPSSSWSPRSRSTASKTPAPPPRPSPRRSARSGSR